MTTDLMSRPSAGNSQSDDLSDAAGSGEFDLRDLIYQSLERDGLISRLKAQLRAAVFTTIDKASSPSATTSSHSTSHPLSFEGNNGRLARAIVLDWLACSHLPYTEDVLKVETSGSQHPPTLSREEVLEQLPVKTGFHDGQPILYTLLNQLHHVGESDRKNSSTETLPKNVKESIDGIFNHERTIDFSRLRPHFQSLFSSNFDISILNAYLDKHASSSLTRSAYEDLCLNWIQACAKSLQPTIQAMPPNTITIHPRQVSTHRVKSAKDDSSSSSESASEKSSSSTTSSDERLKQTAISNLVTTQLNANLAKKTTNILPSPPQLIDFDDDDDEAEVNDDDPKNKDDEDEDEDTSLSILSKRNATPAALVHLKEMERIIQGDETPRTRTNVDKSSRATARNAPVEYDDESFSQSHSILSSVDDVTVDRTSSSATGPVDYLEDF